MVTIEREKKREGGGGFIGNNKIGSHQGILVSEIPWKLSKSRVMCNTSFQEIFVKKTMLWIVYKKNKPEMNNFLQKVAKETKKILKKKKKKPWEGLSVVYTDYTFLIMCTSIIKLNATLTS